MNNKFLIAGLACLSLFAAAQSQQDQTKKTEASTTKVQSPRDHTSGQSSGRTGIVHRDLAVRESPTRQSTGKTTAQDDWHQQNAASTGNSGSVKTVSAGDLNGDGKADRVAKGDVNGDGAADAAAPKNSGHATERQTATPREASSGMATGKRMHKPLTITKETDREKK
jgi:hypothetical protein